MAWRFIEKFSARITKRSPAHTWASKFMCDCTFAVYSGNRSPTWQSSIFCRADSKLSIPRRAPGHLNEWRRLRRCARGPRGILRHRADERARDRLPNQIVQPRPVHRAARVRAVHVRSQRERPRRRRKNYCHGMKALRTILRPLLLVCAVIAAVWLALPKPPLLDGISFSQCVRDRNGKLLRVTLSADQKFRIWTPLNDISPDLIDATLRYEDK